MTLQEKYPIFECTEEYCSEYNGEEKIMLHKTITVTGEHTNVYSGETILEVWIDYKEPLAVYTNHDDSLTLMRNVRDVMDFEDWKKLYEARTSP